MNISRLIVGLFFVVLGIVLVVISFFESFFILIYGIPCLVIGFVILLNRKEDEIEQRKDLNKKKIKK